MKTLEEITETGLSDPLQIDRRRFMGFILGGTGLALSLTSLAHAHNAAKSTQNQDVKYDISYIWHKDLESVLDYMIEVGNVLGPAERKKLRVVSGRLNYGLVYDLNESLELAKKVAAEHSKRLEDVNLDKAIPIRDVGYWELYNISYGVGPNFSVQKTNFDKIWKALPEVQEDLVIEETSDGNFALVYKKYGDKKSMFELAGIHTTKLKNKGLSASIIREQGFDFVYGGSSRLDEEIEPELKKRPKTETVKPKPAPTPDKKLEKTILNLIGTLRRRKKILNDEKTSWSIYDFTSGEKLVSINEDVSMQAASMVKPLVALAFFHEVGKGRLSYDSTSRAKLRASIQRSNNDATNWIFDKIGGPNRVQQILTQNYGHIFKNTYIVEKIPPGGQTYSNKSSARDYSRFLYALWNDQLPYSRETRRLMSLPKRSRIKGPRVPKGTLVYNKTGSTSMLCGDFGILVPRDRKGNPRPYTLIGIIQKGSRAQNYWSWSRSRGNVIREVSDAAYDFIKAGYQLQ